MEVKTAAIYNRSASKWSRNEPVSLSDYTGRPAVFKRCGDVTGLKIADLGCGEGYCARLLSDSGAAQIDGIDISEGMIYRANAAKTGSRRASFQVGEITNIPLPSASYDIAIGVFVYNYLSVEETRVSFQEVHRLLKTDGRFIFCVPHPSLPFIRKEQSPPFYFAFEHGGYFSNRDIRADGKIWRRDGQELPVEMHHKLLKDYFDALRSAGFSQMPEVEELGVTQEILKIDPKFFGPLFDIPLHLLIEVKK